MNTDTAPEKAALRRAAAVVGGQAALAAGLGFSNRTGVWPWFNTARRVPAEYCPAIERLTDGQVKCEELRPDVQWEVLRRSAEPTNSTADPAAQAA